MQEQFAPSPAGRGRSPLCCGGAAAGGGTCPGRGWSRCRGVAGTCAAASASWRSPRAPPRSCCRARPACWPASLQGVHHSDDLTHGSLLLTGVEAAAVLEAGQGVRHVDEADRVPALLHHDHVVIINLVIVSAPAAASPPQPRPPRGGGCRWSRPAGRPRRAAPGRAWRCGTGRRAGCRSSGGSTANSFTSAIQLESMLTRNPQQ